MQYGAFHYLRTHLYKNSRPPPPLYQQKKCIGDLTTPVPLGVYVINGRPLLC